MAEQPEQVSMLDLPKPGSASSSPSSDNTKRSYGAKLYERGEDVSVFEDVMEYVQRKLDVEEKIGGGVSGSEQARQSLSEVFRKVSTMDASRYVVAGLCTGMANAVATQPLDCVKTRIQVFKRLNMNIGSSSSVIPARNIFESFMKSKSIDMLLNIYKQEGWKALYRYEDFTF